MLGVTARIAHELSHRAEWCVFSNGSECVARMMAMLVLTVTTEAQIVVFAVQAGHENVLLEFYRHTVSHCIRNGNRNGHTLNTAVASARSVLVVFAIFSILLVDVVCTWHLWNSGLLNELGLGGETLGGAAHNLAFHDETLDEPVLAWAMDANINAVCTKIVVSIIAGVAVIVLVGHGLVAGVAEYGPGGSGCWGWSFGTESHLALAREASKLGDEALVVQPGRHALGCCLSGDLSRGRLGFLRHSCATIDDNGYECLRGCLCRCGGLHGV